MLKKVFLSLSVIVVIIIVILFIWHYSVCGSGSNKIVIIGSRNSPLDYYCLANFSDGGMPCTSSTECQGNCVVNIDHTQATCAYNDERSCEKSLPSIEECPLGQPEQCIRACDLAN